MIRTSTSLSLPQSVLDTIREVAGSHTVNFVHINRVPLVSAYDIKISVDGDYYTIRIMPNPTMTPYEQLVYKIRNLIRELEAPSGTS